MHANAWALLVIWLDSVAYATDCVTDKVTCRSNVNSESKFYIRFGELFVTAGIACW